MLSGSERAQRHWSGDDVVTPDSSLPYIYSTRTTGHGLEITNATSIIVHAGPIKECHVSQLLIGTSFPIT